MKRLVLVKQNVCSWNGDCRISNGPIGKNVSLALANLGQPKVYLIDFAFVKPLDEKSYTTYLKHLKNYNS
jgi:hypothetical protein